MAKPTSNAESDKFTDEMKALYPGFQLSHRAWSKLVKHARGSVFVYDPNLKGFRQQECESDTFKSVPEIMSYLQRAPQPHGHTTESAAQTNEEMLGSLTQAVEYTNKTKFIEFPLENPWNGPVVVALKRALKLFDADWAQSSSTMESQTSTTGRLFYAPDRSRIQFWTPRDSLPFLHLSLVKLERKGIQRQWLAVLAYDKASMWTEGRIARCRERFETYRYTDNPDPNATEAAPFQAFAHMLSYFIAPYIRAVGEEAEAFKEAIQAVANSMGSGPTLSALLRELNAISHKIMESNLETRFAFSTDAAEWADDILRSLNPDHTRPELPMIARVVEEYHPDHLREVIAEVRQQINDTIAERQQERQEELQQREDARAEREAILLEQSIRIAEETKRDSRTMRGIAWVTVAFLPATFVTSFFGMNFFNGIAGKVPFDEASRNVWLFFAIAIPISGIVLTIFYFWDKQTERKDVGMLKSAENGSR